MLKSDETKKKKSMEGITFLGTNIKKKNHMLQYHCSIK